MPVGSVVSFMLPNWHEAAVVYQAATMAGMVVNPILPSLRDRELLFILNDADTRMIFVPAVFGRHDYAAMLNRIVTELKDPPEVVVVRDGASLPARKPAGRIPRAGSRRRADDLVHVGYHWSTQGRSAQP